MTIHHAVHHGAASPTAPPEPREQSEAPRPAALVCCAALPYEEAWNLQRACREARAAGRCHDLLLLMEHPSVFTLGRTTQDQHWPGADRLTQETGIPVIQTERGGSITYHGPGQLVGYPILRLTDYCAGPKTYVRWLEDVLIATLAEWGIAAHRREPLPGVWVGGNHPSKIASIGVRISQGITTHGFALNVCPDLTPFSHIVPCGISDCRVTSIEALVNTAPDIRLVQQQVAARFAERFHITWAEAGAPEHLSFLMNQPDGHLIPAPYSCAIQPEGAS